MDRPDKIYRCIAECSGKGILLGALETILEVDGDWEEVYDKLLQVQRKTPSQNRSASFDRLMDALEVAVK